MIRSNTFRVKPELEDRFVQNLEEHINIVLTSGGFYVYTDDSWPEHRYQPEDQSYHDFDLLQAIQPYLDDEQIVVLPSGEVGAQAQTDAVAITNNGNSFNISFQ